MEAAGDFELINCNTCGRHFSSEVLLKHEPICIKNSKKKRKIFNSGKQRAEGSDIPINKILKPGEIPKPDPKLAIAEARTKKWREKHNLLVESFRAARDYAKAKSIGAPLPPPPPALIDSSLVQCPYCQRRFNEESSKRHITFCKEHQAKVAPKTTTVAVKKPPLIKPPQQKAKPSQPTLQKIPVSSSNETRQRTVPQSPVSSNSHSDDSAIKTTKSNVSLPARSISMRTQASALLPSASAPQRPTIPRASTTGTSKPSALPRGPMTIKKPNIIAAAKKPSPTMAQFCHECGNAYPVVTARFCSDCGVRRLAI